MAEKEKSKAEKEKAARAERFGQDDLDGMTIYDPEGKKIASGEDEKKDDGKDSSRQK